MLPIHKLFPGGAVMLASLLSLPVAFATPSPAYLSFHVPHSSATYPLSINKDLTITGYYVDSSGNDHGFVRCFDGTITVFDVPDSLQTKPVSINDAGEIAGFYFSGRPYSNQPVPLGFIRHKDGNISTFGVITDNSIQSFLPQPFAINRHGEVVGVASDSAGGFNPFFRSASGTIRSIEVNDQANYSSFPTALNGHGDVVGYGASDYLFQSSGLLWKDTGGLQSLDSYTLFSYPGSSGTAPTAINDKDEIAGCYNVSNVYYDFLRTPSGSFIKLDTPGTVPSCLATYDVPFVFLFDLPPAVSLNNRGTVIGQVINSANIPIGFVRFPDGRTIPFAIPESTSTTPTAINDADVITGYCIKGGRTEGFIALP